MCACSIRGLFSKACSLTMGRGLWRKLCYYLVKDECDTIMKEKELECGPMPNVVVALPEYRWRRVLNAAKFGSRPLLECRTVTLPI